MEITTNYNTLFQISNYFQKLEQETNHPFSIRRKIARFNEEVQKEMRFFNEEITKLIQKYGAKDENGGLIRSGDGIKIQEEFTVEAGDKIQELHMTELTFEAPLVKFPESIFDNIQCDRETIKFIEKYLLEE